LAELEGEITEENPVVDKPVCEVLIRARAESFALAETKQWIERCEIPLEKADPAFLKIASDWTVRADGREGSASEGERVPAGGGDK
jgi:hypothetical protein